MKTTNLFILLMLLSGLLYGETYHVTPAGNSSNDGSSFSDALDIYTALDLVNAGDSILLFEGTYNIPYTSGEKNTILLSKSGSSGNPISIVGYNNQIAVIDFSFPEQQWVQDSYGFEVNGSYWYFRNIMITRAGYQGAYVRGSNNTFENCIFYDNRNTGLEINEGGSYTTVINCDAYYNYDPKKNGSMADGFAPKQEQGPGNTFYGCRAWENSDDGYDCFDSPEKVTFENCWAFRNGVDVWNYGGFDGNANGFKVGGNGVAADNVLTNCVAFGHPNKGFDQNNNAGSVTLYNCTSFDNGTNYGFGNPVNSGEEHIFRNNLSYNGSISISNASDEYNSWNLSYSISDSDFRSLNSSLATASRDQYGNLPVTDLFRLAQSSGLIDAGTDVGLPYEGNAPDIGAFEYGGGSAVYYTLSTSVNGQGSVSPNSGSYQQGSSVTIYAEPSSGWEFSHWSGDINDNTNPYTITMNEDQSITANFVESTGGCTFTSYQAEDGTWSNASVDTDHSGYTGTGFVNTDNNSGEWIEIPVNVSSSGSYEVRIRYANGASDRPAQITVNGTEQISNLSLPGTGAWDSWSNVTFNVNYTNGSNTIRFTANGSSGLPNIDMIEICEGETSVTEYSLSTSVNGQGSVNPLSGTYNEGEVVTLTASPSSGWQFDNWTGDAGGSSATVNITMDSDKNVTANFSEIPPDQYSLSTQVNGQGSVSLNPSGGTYDEGTTVTVTANPASGWQFDGWSGALGGSTNPASVTMNSNLSVTANFSEISTSSEEIVLYTFDQSSGTSITDASGNGNTATVNGGAGFTSGQLNNAIELDGSDDYVSMPTGILSSLNDFTIATWVNIDAVETWSRIFDFGTGTSVNMFLTPQSGSGNVRFAITTGGSGGEQQINGTSALPSNTWTHVAVTLSGNIGTLYVNGSAVGSNSNMTLSPSDLGNTGNNYIGQSQYPDPFLDGQVDQFHIYNYALSSSELSSLYDQENSTQATTYTLTTSVNGQGTVSPSGGTYDEGTVVNLTASPANGWQFDSWSGDASGSSATINITMDSDKSVTANISEINEECIFYSYQAENGNWSNANVETEHSGYTGDGYVNTENNSGEWIELTVNVPSSGSKDVVIRYANGSSDRPAEVSINGNTQISNLSLPGTGAWNSWSTSDFVVNLNESDNTIRFIANGSSGLPNVDKVEVCQSSAPKNAGSVTMNNNDRISISDNYPNPFNNFTNIDIQLKKPESVIIQIYNMVGELIRIEEFSDLPQGINTLKIEREDMPAGIYMYKIYVGNKTINDQMIVE